MIARETGSFVSPPIPVGESSPLMDFPGTMTTSLGVFTDYLRDYSKSLIKYGIRRIFVVCAHVGNVPAVSSVAYDLHDQALFGMVDLWRFIAKQAEGIVESDCIPEGHASEVGTSVLMALRPDLVDMDKAVKEVPPSRYAPQPGMYQYPYLGDLTKSGVIGDPFLASAEKGKRMIDKTVKSITSFLEDFGQEKVEI